jgi:short chain dehydrogenase
MGALQREVVMVTGGCGEIGRDICRAFATEGARIAIIDADRAATVALGEELDPHGTRVIPIQCIAVDGDDIVKAVQDAADWFGAVDVLVNSVSADRRRSSVMLRYMTACRPHLKRGGHVINVGTDSVTVALPESVARDGEWDKHAVTSLVHVVDDDEPATFVDEVLDDLDRLFAGVAVPSTKGALVA